MLKRAVSCRSRPVQKPGRCCRAPLIGGTASDQAFCDGLNEAIAGKLAPLTLSNALQTTAARDARAHGVTTAVEARRQFGATLRAARHAAAGGRQGLASITTSSMRPHCDSCRDTTVSAASSDPFAKCRIGLVEWAAGALALKLTDAERRTLIDHDTSNAARARALPARVRLSDRPARAGEYRPRDRPLHAGARNRWTICARLRRSRPSLLAEVRGLDFDPDWSAKARSACRQALEIDQHLSAAHVCLGIVSNGSGQYADARAASQKALESNELSDEGLMGLAFAEQHLGDLQRGRTDLPDCGGNAGRATGPVASGLRPSIASRVDTTRPPSSSGKPSS